ncbi:MAG: aminotransferase class I/II-fold pyridoxal phosphate-dependent enzyme [Acidobacteriota bacterium]
MTTRQDNPLELDPEAMRRLVDQALERLVGHVESLPEQALSATSEGAAVARSLVEALPERGVDFDELLELLFEHAIPCSYNTASPGYLAYIPGGGLFQSAVADLIAGATNRYVGLWLAAPALVELEANVVRWLAEMVGYPASAGGLLTTGGSLANLTAMVTARSERLPEDFLRGTLYTSDQAHHSVIKAATIAGFPPRNVRSVAVDDRFRLRLDALEEQIQQDRQDGLKPFLVVGNAGTTNTGAVDDLAGLASVAERHGLWLHIDAAYGGFFALTERGRSALEGLERADSITLDPHKGLFLPYGNGSLLMRDPAALKRAFSSQADYLPAMQSTAERVDYCELSPELSRDFRGLRVWLPIKLHGIDAFRRNLDEKLDLARWAADELRRIPQLEILAEPQLSLVVFRLAPPGLDDAALDALNRDFQERINQRQRVFLTGTLLGSVFALRICVLSFRTHLDRMEMALEDIRRAAAEVGDPEVIPEPEPVAAGAG